MCSHVKSDDFITQNLETFLIETRLGWVQNIVSYLNFKEILKLQKNYILNIQEYEGHFLEIYYLQFQSTNLKITSDICWLSTSL